MHRSFQPPAEVRISHSDPLKGVHLLFWIRKTIFFIFGLHSGPTSNGVKRSPPAEPHTGGKHEYNGVLPGAPRGSFTTLANFHSVPRSPRHDASHLGLGGLVLMRLNPHEPPGPKMYVRGERYIPDGQRECDHS
jgi:hypothetical protein